MEIYIRRVITKPQQYVDGLAEVIVENPFCINRLFVCYKDFDILQDTYVEASIQLYSGSYYGYYSNVDDYYEIQSKYMNFNDGYDIECIIPIGYDYGNNGRYQESCECRLRGIISEITECDGWYYPKISCRHMLIDAMIPKPKIMDFEEGFVVDCYGFLQMFME